MLLLKNALTWPLFFRHVQLHELLIFAPTMSHLHCYSSISSMQLRVWYSDEQQPMFREIFNHQVLKILAKPSGWAGPKLLTRLNPNSQAKQTMCSSKWIRTIADTRKNNPLKMAFQWLLLLWFLCPKFDREIMKMSFSDKIAHKHVI